MGKLRHGATKRGTAGDAQHPHCWRSGRGLPRRRAGLPVATPLRGAPEMRMYRACAGLAGTCPRRVGSVGGGGWRSVRAGGGRRYPEHPSLASRTPLGPEHPSLASRIPLPFSLRPHPQRWVRGGAVGAASYPRRGLGKDGGRVESVAARGVPYGLGQSRAAVAVRLLGC